MSKLVDITKYLTCGNYAEKYGICPRKVYRHRYDDDIDFINIDGKHFIRDERSIKLEINNSGRPPKKNVTNLTLNEKNVTNLTLNEKNVTNSGLNKENNSVKNLTNSENKNVKKLTDNKIKSVKNLTFKTRLDELLAIPEDERSIRDFEEIQELSKKV